MSPAWNRRHSMGERRRTPIIVNYREPGPKDWTNPQRRETFYDRAEAEAYMERLRASGKEDVHLNP